MARSTHALFFPLILTAALSLSGCATTRFPAKDNYCATRYPIILIHGIGFRDTSALLDYWGDLPDYLRTNGATVFPGGQDAFGSIADNAARLKTQVELVLLATGAQKVNLVAHSRGGLEARYMVSRLGMADKVASLTTIATPHRGSALADVLVNKLDRDGFIVHMLDHFSTQGGDKNPQSYSAGTELTRKSLERFNQEVPDSPGVYYQSWAGWIDSSVPSIFWSRVHKVMIEQGEGENDGFVSVESAKWGRWRGIIGDRKFQVTHDDETAREALLTLNQMDIVTFYRNCIHELGTMGF